ncbi:MAG: lytic transglycosylase domain-containing protein [Elusimicrobiota bacterium]|nr:lytic transglycosylase domain-containing protein [Elusimicrobiota bacterium]
MPAAVLAALFCAAPALLRAEEPALLAALGAAHAAGPGAAAVFDAARAGPAAPDSVMLAADAPSPEAEERPARERRPDPPPFAVRVPESPPPPVRRLRPGPRTSGYDALIRRYARRCGLDARLVKAVIAGESEFSRRATSRAGARGLMQVMPATAREVGVAPERLYSAEANIRAGTAYLARLFARAWRRYHLKGVDYRLAPAWVVQRVLAAYNAGPRFLARRRLYRQTRDYVAKVLSFYRSTLTELPEAVEARPWPLWTGIGVWRPALSRVRA